MEHFNVVTCIPTRFSPAPPVHQSECHREICPECDEEVWMSKKKQQILNQTENRRVLCWICLAKEVRSLGISASEIQANNIF